MEWVKDFLTPLIKVIFIGGFGLTALFYTFKGFYNAWQKSWRFIWKYSIRRKKYPETTVVWCWEAIDKGVGWYDAKKILMVKSVDPKTINETLWIYDKIISELNNEKGGVKNGRKYKGSNSTNENKSKTLPEFS